jgi:NitT/TauT family transport system ATP-binding protein
MDAVKPAGAESITETIIEARGVAKFYGPPGDGCINVIAPTDFVVRAGQILALLGPSGCGKSTLLRILTGLVPPSAGQVLWSGRPIDEHPPSVAVVFQSFALFPWLTVVENVEAPLQAEGWPRVIRRKRALKTLHMVGLKGFETAYPKELSGGMKQRVGFARALVVEPEVLFMDEPFSALDVLTAENLRGELLDLWQGQKIPTRAIFLVTHNIEEAIALGDRVMVLGGNPAHVRTDFDVRLSHPRERKSERFLELVDYVYKVLTKPDEEAAPPVGAKPEAVTGPARYPMLPHPRPGGISGLLEILHDGGDREELYRLAANLSMEVDDLLPIVDAAVLLEFARLREGDIELTDQGKRFAEADILARKALFREAGLEHVVLLRQIHQTLRAKSDHEISDSFYLDVLENHFSPDEARRQLETVIQWGRYSGILDYAADRGRLFLPPDA